MVGIYLPSSQTHREKNTIFILFSTLTLMMMGKAKIVVQSLVDECSKKYVEQDILKVNQDIENHLNPHSS